MVPGKDNLWLNSPTLIALLLVWGNRQQLGWLQPPASTFFPSPPLLPPPPFLTSNCQHHGLGSKTARRRRKVGPRKLGGEGDSLGGVRGVGGSGHIPPGCTGQQTWSRDVFKEDIWVEQESGPRAGVRLVMLCQVLSIFWRCSGCSLGWCPPYSNHAASSFLPLIKKKSQPQTYFSSPCQSTPQLLILQTHKDFARGFQRKTTAFLLLLDVWPLQMGWAALAKFLKMLYLDYSRNPNKWSNTIAGDSQLSVHTPPKFLVPLFVGKSRKLESKGGRPLKKKKKSHGFLNTWDCSQCVIFRGTQHQFQWDFKRTVIKMLLNRHMYS